MEFKEIIYEKKDGVAKVTIIRPERYNALPL
jgi:1,4-dihydroxy-2-naphthoyl-CoA synthase